MKLRKNLGGLTLAACLFSGAVMGGNNHKVYHAVVAQDGTGDYTTVQQAIDAAPSGSTTPWLIFVKNGSYEESVKIPAEKTFIHLIGQDKEKTIIHRDLNVGGKPEGGKTGDDILYWKTSVHNPESPVYKAGGSVVIVDANDFYTENISYINDFGVNNQRGPQALAMNSDGDRATFNNCVFRSFQDTWMTTRKDENRHYVKNCWIEGAVDYFYGGGNVLVENSTLYNVRRGSVIVAPCHEKAKWGYVFRHCIVDGNEKARERNQTALGRPWHNAPKAVYIHTTMNIPISPKGWTDMGTIPEIFAEYDSRDAQGNVLDLSQRKNTYKGRGDNPPTGTCPTTISKADADRMVYENIIPGNDNWDPRAMMQQLPAPKGVKVKGANVTWKAVKGAKGYVVLQGDKAVGFTAEPSFKLAAADGKEVRVRAVNQFGSLGK